MSSRNHLLHSHLISSIPLGQTLTRRLLNRRVEESLLTGLDADPSVTVVVRTLNEATTLEFLLADVRQQVFTSEIEIIVVDNESTDGTPEVARRYGAEVVSFPRSEFTYPRSMNLGMVAASHDVVFLTVGHARLSSIYSLHAGARHFTGGSCVAGAFGTVLPNAGASRVERFAAAIDGNRQLVRPAQPVRTAGQGVLGGTGAMLAKPVWEELERFDERYETGGEDTAMAGRMIANGYAVVREPALSVHHSHGLGPIDSVKQMVHQVQTLKAPRRFDREELLDRRPDLRANVKAPDPSAISGDTPHS